MARKSKLSEKQWAEVDRRLLEGDAARAIARDFDLSEAAVRSRKNTHVAPVKDVANQIVSTQRALKALPITSQQTAQTLAQKLMSLSDNLLGAAMYGAATAHRLNAIANDMVQKVDDAEPLKSMEALKAVAVIGKIASEQAHIGLQLVNANKGNMPVEPPEAPDVLPANPQDAAIEYAKFMS